MQTCTVLGVDTCTYLPVERRNAPPLRLHRLQATGTVGSADQPSLLNPRFEPRLRLDEGAGRSTLTLRKVRAVLELRHVEVELSFEQRPRGGVCTTIATGVWVGQTNPVC